MERTKRTVDINTVGIEIIPCGLDSTLPKNRCLVKIGDAVIYIYKVTFDVSVGETVGWDSNDYVCFGSKGAVFGSVVQDYVFIPEDCVRIMEEFDAPT